MERPVLTREKTIRLQIIAKLASVDSGFVSNLEMVQELKPTAALGITFRGNTGRESCARREEEGGFGPPLLGTGASHMLGKESATVMA